MGRYEVVLPLASGGMATVYLARSYGAGGFGREVALKLMHAHLRETPEFGQSLLAEAQLMVSIRHPNVVPVLDVGDDPRGLFLVMELVEGDTVGGLQKRARHEGLAIPPPIQARLLLDALAGLHAAHESRAEDGRSHEMVHRDFSPQNLLVGLDGVTRLTDFGIARAATQLVHTRTGLVKGKASYMAPEQARGLPIDRRCDVWAAGVVAWELIADRRLFRADNDLATVVRVLSETAPRLDDEAGAPGAVADAVERARHPEVDGRWPTAAAFRGALLEAFRAGDGVAEHDEVAAFVASLLGDRLAARREQAAAVLRERHRAPGPAVDAAAGPAAGPAVDAPPGPLLAVAPSPSLAPAAPAVRSPWSWRHGAALLAALAAAALAGHRLQRAGATAATTGSGAAPGVSAAASEPAASAAARAGEAGAPAGGDERAAAVAPTGERASAPNGEHPAAGPTRGPGARGAAGRAGTPATPASSARAGGRGAGRAASTAAATLAPSPYGAPPR